MGLSDCGLVEQGFQAKDKSFVAARRTLRWTDLHCESGVEVVAVVFMRSWLLKQGLAFFFSFA